jgi:hypothetical protein
MIKINTLLSADDQLIAADKDGLQRDANLHKTANQYGNLHW